MKTFDRLNLKMNHFDEEQMSVKISNKSEKSDIESALKSLEEDFEIGQPIRRYEPVKKIDD
jgi:hypothetical protein